MQWVRKLPGCIKLRLAIHFSGEETSMFSMFRYIVLILAAMGLAACSTMGMGGGTAQNTTQPQAELASEAASLLQQQMSQPPQKRIPTDLIANARCIGVFPSIIKAGLIIGGHRGKGLISCRQDSGGFGKAAPVIYAITGGSVGLQAGVQQSSVILLFET